MMTTDNQNELFDVVDENDHVIGQATRGEVHKNKSLIHRSVGIIVQNKKGEIFLQQRSATKDTEPLKWAISASGHVLRGDTYEVTAKRELQEELGVTLPIEEIGKYVCKTPFETEMQMLYKAQSEGPFRLHPQEIAQGTFFTQEEIERLYKEGKLDLSFSAKVSLGKVGFSLAQ